MPKGIFKRKPFTEEHKRKIGLASSISQKGVKTSELTKQKISKALTGRKLSEETKQKLRLLGLGRKLSEETKKKLSVALKGEKNWNWQGGISSLYDKIRSCLEYRLWRSDCFRRDDFICQDCNIRGGKLSVDHIKPFAIIIAEQRISSLEQAMNCEELWDINNGRTLCWECHKKTDTFLVKTKNLLLRTK